MRIQRNRRIPRRHRRRAARLVHDDGATGTGILTLEARSRAVSKRRSSRTRAPLRGGPARPVRPEVPMPLAVRAAHLPGHPLPGGLHPGVVLEWDRVIEAMATQSRSFDSQLPLAWNITSTSAGALDWPWEGPLWSVALQFCTPAWARRRSAFGG